MTAAAARAINCDSCGAGQSVLGGPRVAALVCTYCGATLDAQNGFKAISERRALDWPKTPFAIGDEGEVDGVRVTVIGTLGLSETWAGGSAHWVEHQIYTPSHGYAWLTWEDGQIVFTRKERRAPSPPTFTPAAIETANAPPVARIGQERFVYFQSGHRRIDFAAGAFNFSPAVGDRAYVVDTLGREAMLSFAMSEGEVEWERSVLLDRDATLKSFGVDASAVAPPPPGVHPLQPYRPSIWVRELKPLAAIAAVAALLLSFLFLGEGRRVDGLSWRPAEERLALDVDIRDASRLVELRLEADVFNAWAWFDVEVTDDRGETVFEVGKGVEYYEGYDEGRWTEGSRRGSLYFRPPSPGAYRVEASIAEGGIWRAGRQARQARLSVYEGVGSMRPLLILAIGLGILAAALYALQWRHQSRRWASSDWSDEA